MKIGFSINGQGRGHLTRILALAERMADESNSIPTRFHHESFEPVFWCPEKYHREIRDSFPEANMFSIPYYRIVMDGNRVDVLRTGISNAEHFSSLPAYTSEIADQLRLAHIDAVVSDFEPFAARAAMRLDIPVIQLNHPGVVLKSPSLLPDALIAKAVALGMMGEYHEKIISSFYHGDVGPIIRKELRDTIPIRGDYYVVYLHEVMREKIYRYLESYSPIPFHVFPDTSRDFAEYLAGCRGVITNAGHQLLSETLHLGKACFSFPLEGQYEQRLNARMIEASGRGISAAANNLFSRLDHFFRCTEDAEKIAAPYAEGFEQTIEADEEVRPPSSFILHDDSLRAARLVHSIVQRRRAAS